MCFEGGINCSEVLISIQEIEKMELASVFERNLKFWRDEFQFNRKIKFFQISDKFQKQKKGKQKAMRSE